MTPQAERVLQGLHQVKGVQAMTSWARPGHAVLEALEDWRKGEEGVGLLTAEISATHTFPASLLVRRHTAPVGQRRTCLDRARQMEACFGPHSHTHTLESWSPW